MNSSAGEPMRRREFITLVGGVAAWPLAARAQQPLMPVIGFLGSESPDLWASRLNAFRLGLGESGFIEGRNVTVEYRWAESDYSRLPTLALELAHRQVTLMATGTVPGVRAAKAATTTIPVVFVTAGDPVKRGLVASLRQPGGNLTGVTYLGVEVGPKRVELLHDLMPKAGIVALLVNPTNPALADAITRGAQGMAASLGLQVNVLHASSEQDLAAVFATLRQSQAGGLVIGSDAFFSDRNKQLAALAARYAVPTVFESREFVTAGGLISYGANVTELWHVAGVYSGRILKGEKPADLPVQESTKVELLINLKTAKALGITMPTGLLVRADEVIE
jgi:putative tryptophan/tyrosine transport system substrate-binding protein